MSVPTICGAHIAIAKVTSAMPTAPAGINPSSTLPADSFPARTLPIAIPIPSTASGKLDSVSESSRVAFA